jgi:hypothetical protein
MTPLDEPYLALLFNYLTLPRSAPAIGAMSVAVAVAYIIILYVGLDGVEKSNYKF